MPDHSNVPVPGEWYWGAECPLCGALVPLFHDPSRGKSDIALEGMTQGEPYVGLRCPRNHSFDVPVDRLTPFEFRS